MKTLCTITFIILSVFLQSCAPLTELTEREPAQFEELMPYSELITPDYLRSHLEVIAHDSLQGRDTGTEGERAAARYIIEQYERLGIATKGTNGTYLQPFMLNAERTDSLVYEVFQVENADTLVHTRSVVANNSSGDFIRLFGGANPLKGDIIFGGFGIDDTARGVNHLNPELMKDKWVLIFADFPTVVDGDTLINPAITNNQRVGNLFGEVDAGGVLVVSASESSRFREAADVNSRLIDQPNNMRLQYLDDSSAQGGFPKSYTQVSPELAVEILGLNSTRELFTLRKQIADNITDFQPETTGYHLDYTPYDGTVEVESNNVIGYIEGSDPSLKMKQSF